MVIRQCEDSFYDAVAEWATVAFWMGSGWKPIRYPLGHRGQLQADIRRRSSANLELVRGDLWEVNAWACRGFLAGPEPKRRHDFQEIFKHGWDFAIAQAHWRNDLTDAERKCKIQDFVDNWERGAPADLPPGWSFRDAAQVPRSVLIPVRQPWDAIMPVRRTP